MRRGLQDRGQTAAGRRSSGQILVVFAITATSLLAVVGLLYSFGLILGQRRSLQAAADAASLSGAWQVLGELASDNRSDGVVLASIVQFATANGLPSDGTATNATYLSAEYLDANGTPLAPNVSVGSAGTFPSGARGVRVRVQRQVPTILPNVVKVVQVLVQSSAAAVARPTSSPAAASNVLPVAVPLSAARTAYSSNAAYDLLAHPVVGAQAPILDFTANGAPTFGPLSNTIQYWSDGQHAGSWQLSQPTGVALADAGYLDAFVTGLRDNIRRQALVDATGAAYALVTVPVYDTATTTTVHVVGFAMLKVRAANVSMTSVRSTFVPYPVAAYGTPGVPTTDVGAAVVGLVS